MDKTATSTLRQVSDALAALVAHAGRHVVRVEARRRGNASGIIWDTEGHVLSAHHAVQRDEDLYVGLPDGERVPARLIGRDPSTDVAVLRIEGTAAEPPAWTEADSLGVGHLVLSVGRHDEHAQAALGIVSARDGAWRTPTGGKVDAYVQTDIVIYPGFSGSALVDADGRVAGMNTSWLIRQTSILVPTTTLRRMVSAILEHGSVRQGYLGISAQPVALPRSAGEALAQETGLLVLAVEEDTPADRAGVMVGDIVVALAGEPVRRLDDLFAQLAEHVNQETVLDVVRGGQQQHLPVTIAERG